MQDTGRYPERSMIRTVVRGTGKTLIATGVLILLFVVYQLWGTGISHAREQRSLRAAFARRLAAVPTTAPAAAPSSGTTTTAPVDVVPSGCDHCVAVINIPKIGLDEIVVDDVGVEDLKKGVGHYPDTKMPGQPGNVGFAGHRTTYGHPFNRIDELDPGDPILVTTLSGVTYRYETVGQTVVTPEHVEVLDDTPDNRLTLTTCNPKYSAAQRLIVTAKLVTPLAPAPAQPAPAPPQPRKSQLASESAGLSGAAAAKRPAVAWAILATSVWLGAWAVGKWTGWRWTAYAVGLPIFLVMLFLFFENFARLLPANV